MATGRRSRDEPPTGASRVIYAEDMLGSAEIETNECNPNPRAQIRSEI